MSYGNCFSPFRNPLSSADFIDCTKSVRAVVSVSTLIADSDCYIFQDNEPVLAFERFPLDIPRLHRAFAFTAIPVPSRPLDEVFVPSQIVSLDLHHTTVQNRLPSAKDAQIVF